MVSKRPVSSTQIHSRTAYYCSFLPETHFFQLSRLLLLLHVSIKRHPSPSPPLSNVPSLSLCHNILFGYLIACVPIFKYFGSLIVLITQDLCPPLEYKFQRGQGFCLNCAPPSYQCKHVCISQGSLEKQIQQNKKENIEKISYRNWLM